MDFSQMFNLAIFCHDNNGESLNSRTQQIEIH